MGSSPYECSWEIQSMAISLIVGWIASWSCLVSQKSGFGFLFEFEDLQCVVSYVHDHSCLLACVLIFMVDVGSICRHSLGID